MNKNDKLFLILVSEIKQTLNNEKVENALEEKLKLAMHIAKNHWLITDSAIQFRGAIGGVMMYYGEDSKEFKRLSWEMRQIEKLDFVLRAAQANIPIDISNISCDNEYVSIGLLKLWKETK